jgi:precorrin-4/cobalt-precorrin-4 C11-methyltransferase
MKVIFVGSGPGDPELLTVRAERLLRGARCCVYAGSLVAETIVGLLPADAERHDSAGLSLDQIVEIIKGARVRNVDVVRLHSGDPSIYGAIGEQMARLDELGIDYEVVPGVSSFQAAAAALKIELTVPEVSQTIVLTRASGRTPLPEHQELEKIAHLRATMCIFLSIHKIDEMARELAGPYGVATPAAVVFHASRPDQVVIRGTLADIAGRTAASGITKTALFIVGNAVARADRESRLYDKRFTHGYREAGA